MLTTITTLVREIRLFDSAVLVVGSMIGSGIFIVSRYVLLLSGVPAYFFWRRRSGHRRAM